MKYVALFLAVCVLTGLTPAWAQAKAFPECQGAGCGASGGRGGSVCMVTNLNDAGTGSLRACLEASGPRTVIFRVGGRINLTSTGFYIPNGNLTVAGQTAPGDGILITGPAVNAHMVAFDSPNIIWRYMRISKGFNQAAADQFIAAGDSPGANQTAFQSATNIVFDHNSMWWNQDEGGSFGGTNGNFTWSNNIEAEGLSPHSTGFLGSGFGGNVDLHHNLLMNNNHRNPKIDNSNFRYVNNLTYNNALRAFQITGGGLNAIDAIGNLYKQGPLNLSGTRTHEFMIGDGPKSVYLLGNKGWNQPNPAGNQWLMTAAGNNNGPETASPAPAAWQRFAPLPAIPFPIVPESVTTLEASLLPVLGDYQRLNCDGTWTNIRNSVDTRLITQYQTNTGITVIPTNENQMGGYPSMKSGTACADADLDGMPDMWEAAHGLNPNNPTDRNGVQPSGYTNLEVYLNGSTEKDVTSPVAPTGLDVR